MNHAARKKKKEKLFHFGTSFWSASKIFVLSYESFERFNKLVPKWKFFSCCDSGFQIHAILM
jgi:hypothetical protein